MASRELVVIFKNYGNVLEILKRISKYKAPVSIRTRRGDLVLDTQLAASTISKLFGDKWRVKHQTEKRIVLVKIE